MMGTESITNEQLAESERLFKELAELPTVIHLSRSDPGERRLLEVTNNLANRTPRLVEEIRTLHHDLDQHAALEAARARQVERLQDDLFGAAVEVDNLRKQREDLVTERDLLKSMLDGANEREQIQLQIAVAAIKNRMTLQQLLEEVLQEIERGRLATIGEAGSTYIPHIGADQVDRWRDRMPKADPHPIEKLVDQALEGGTPT